MQLTKQSTRAYTLALAGGEEMEFQIEYDGPLHAANCTDKKKLRADRHRIRQYLHPQLLGLWEDRIAPHLVPGKEQVNVYLDSRCTRVGRFRFFPIITEPEHL